VDTVPDQHEEELPPEGETVTLPADLLKSPLSGHPLWAVTMRMLFWKATEEISFHSKMSELILKDKIMLFCMKRSKLILIYSLTTSTN